MLALLFRITAALPLPVLHTIGNVLGVFMYACSRADRRHIRDNLKTARLPHRWHNIVRICQETVKSGLELPVAFFRQPEEIVSLFRDTQGWQHVQAALDAGEGLLFITPHIGSYDLAGRYISEHLPFPLTAMYKPPKIKAFDDIMQQGRRRGKGNTAPTSLAGVKQVIKALRAGEATIVLPDHVPDPQEGGEGVWVDFFGRTAYTMTLAGKLAQVKNVRPLFFAGERLPCGRGFRLHIAPLSGSLNGDKTHDAEIINRNVESWVRRFPEQYLFAYNRYKRPEGAPMPPTHRSEAA